MDTESTKSLVKFFTYLLHENGGNVQDTATAILKLVPEFKKLYLSHDTTDKFKESDSTFDDVINIKTLFSPERAPVRRISPMTKQVSKIANVLSKSSINSTAPVQDETEDEDEDETTEAKPNTTTTSKTQPMDTSVGTSNPNITVIDEPAKPVASSGKGKGKRTSSSTSSTTGSKRPKLSIEVLLENWKSLILDASFIDRVVVQDVDLDVPPTAVLENLVEELHSDLQIDTNVKALSLRNALITGRKIEYTKTFFKKLGGSGDFYDHITKSKSEQSKLQKRVKLFKSIGQYKKFFRLGVYYSKVVGRSSEIATYLKNHREESNFWTED